MPAIALILAPAVWLLALLAGPLVYEQLTGQLAFTPRPARKPARHRRPPRRLLPPAGDFDCCLPGRPACLIGQTP